MLLFQKLYRFIVSILEALVSNSRIIVLPAFNFWVILQIINYLANIYDPLVEYYCRKALAEMTKEEGWNTIWDNHYNRWDNPPKMDIMEPIFAQVERDFQIKVFLFGSVMIFGLLFEMYGRYVNRRTRKRVNRENKTGAWAAKDTYEYIITLFDRFFAMGLYLYPACDVYARHAYHLGQVNPEYASLMSLYCDPLSNWYIKYVWGSFYGYGQMAIFFLMFFGIARNRDNVKYFVRYHACQAILVHGVFIFVTQVGDILYYRNPYPLYYAEFGTGMLMWLGLVLTPMLLTAFIGLETRILFVDDAIQYHIGPRPPRRKRRKKDKD